MAGLGRRTPMPDFYLLPDEIDIPSPRHDRKLLGQKPPLRPREVWAIRIRLQIQEHKRDLALFNLAIDSKLRSCDLVALRVQDICLAGRVKDRAVIIQQKTGRPVQFELTDQTRQAAQLWIAERGLHDEDYVFPSRVRGVCAPLDPSIFPDCRSVGLPVLALIHTSTAHIPCGGRRPR